MNISFKAMTTKRNEMLNKYRAAIFWSVLFLFAFPVCFYKLFSIDTWWHIQLGRSILENMAWPDYSTFYYTPVNETVRDLRYTFLGDIFLYLVHLVAGSVGLQMLRVAIVGSVCALMMSMSRWRYNGWNLLLLMLMIIGIYQKLLLRNSIFGIIFTTMIFWLWFQIRYKDNEKLIWVYPFLIGTWGCVHGSYLLGFGLMCLLFLGDRIDSKRGLNPGKNRLTIQFITVTLLSFIAISIYNPITTQYYNTKSIKRLFADRGPIETPLIDNIEESHETAPTINEISNLPVKYAGIAFGAQSNSANRTPITDIFVGIKNYLNSTIWNAAENQINSGDFISPFNNFDQWWVRVSVAFGFLGIILISFYIRPFRLSLLLVFFATLIFGLGYTRLLGYIPIVVTSIAFISFSGKLRFSKKSGEISFVTAALLTIFMYLNVFSGYKVPIGTELHTVGFGAIPTFSSKLPELILDKYKDTPVFTTMSTGGYFLYEWYPRKKVFIDGFFAPHKSEVFKDYYSLRTVEDANPDFLFEKYGIRSAVIETSTGETNWNFFHSDNWYPTMLDRGLMFFEYFPNYDDVPVPEILFTRRDLAFLSNWYKKRIAVFLFQLPVVMLEQGRLKDTVEFLSKNEVLMTKMAKYAEKDQINSAAITLQTYLGDYGMTNDRALAYEIKQRGAMNLGDVDRAIEYGKKVLDLRPDRHQVSVNIAKAYYKKNDFDKSAAIFDKLYQRFLMDDTIKTELRQQVKEYYQRLVEKEKNKENYSDAYEFLLKVNALNDTSSRDDIYMTYATLVEDANRSKGPDVAYHILRRMESDIEFFKGRILNDIAWHIAEYSEEINVNMENGKSYAKQAVKQMEADGDSWIDLAYDTLAEIYFKTKDYKEMREYEQKAIDAAQESRKTNYQFREIPIG